MRTLAIGDVHGCHDALLALLKEIKPTAADRLIFLGDYIDRGPSSREVIESLLELKKVTLPVFLRGNHEVMILDAREDSLKSNLWQSYGGLDALYSYDAHYCDDWVSLIPEAHWAFLEQTQRFFETETHIFVHACLDSELDMKNQPDWLLFWELFDHLKPHKSGKQVICGHTQQGSGDINSVGFGVCIDTGAAYRGWLTCLDVTSGAFWQANQKAHIRSGRLE